ncbi:ATPase [Telluribacter humicola]
MTYPTITPHEFLDLIVKRANARFADRGQDRTFSVDDDNRDVINLLCMYFTDDPRFEEQTDSSGKKYSHRKGIMLVGKRGCGKTLLMEMCSFNPKLPYSISVCQNIVNEFLKKDQAMSTLSKYSDNPANLDAYSHWGHTWMGRFFDDFGSESQAITYGNERNVMDDILMERHRSLPYISTHITSNLTLKQLMDINFYDERLLDRMKEMFNVIEFPPTAQSRRQ